MICPLKLINPGVHANILCEEDCAVRLLSGPVEIEGEEGAKIESFDYCGLANLNREGTTYFKNIEVPQTWESTV